MTDKTYKKRSCKKSGDKPRLIPPHGGYRNLKSYQMATIVYDLTVDFCKKYMSYKANNSYTRTYDQMVQAARSGKQNIAEGSQASGTSKKIELKLVGIARASLAELLADYIDFLRQRRLKQWEKDSDQAREVRRLAYRSDKSYETYKSYVEESETAANCLICLIHQTNYLLDKQLKSLEKDFLEQGGFTERMYRARKSYRSSKSNKAYNSEKGSSLLELMIVMALLVVIMVALVSLAVLSLSTVQKSRLRSTATNIAKDGLENIRFERDEAVADVNDDWETFRDSCPTPAVVQDWAYGSGPTPNPTVYPTVAAGCSLSGGRVSVETEVGWQFGGEWYDVKLETELGPRGEGIYR